MVCGGGFSLLYSNSLTAKIFPVLFPSNAVYSKSRTSARWTTFPPRKLPANLFRRHFFAASSTARPSRSRLSPKLTMRDHLKPRNTERLPQVRSRRVLLEKGTSARERMYVCVCVCKRTGK